MRLPLQKDLSLANRLISVLPTHERGLFLEYSELVEFKLHAVLIEVGQQLDHAYFPVEGFVSSVLPVMDAPNIDVGLVGDEGMFNASLVLGVTTSTFTSLVQGSGRAFRIRRNALQHRLNEDCWLRDVLNRYVDVRASQLSQQAACMNFHTVEQRLARLLLMTRDRAHSCELFLTHEALALMLGVRRESVSKAASSFQKHALLSYSRGYMVLIDETGLQEAACKCYQADLTAYERALAMSPHVRHMP
jgi:CRP-like cAMP-binding protein